MSSDRKVVVLLDSIKRLKPSELFCVILFALSTAALSARLVPYTYSKNGYFTAQDFAMLPSMSISGNLDWNIVFMTACVSALMSFFVLSYLYEKISDFITAHKISTVLIAIISIWVCLCLQAGQERTTDWPMCQGIWCLLCTPAMICWLIVLFDSASKFASSLRKDLSPSEGSFYVTVSVVLSMTVFILHSINNFWYMQYDTVYSYDSALIFIGVSNPSYYEIQHPAIGPFVFLIKTLATMPETIFSPWAGFAAGLLIQILIVQFLMASAAILYILTKKKYVAIAFMCSWPFILQSFLLEKFAVIVFLILVFAYSALKTKDNGYKGCVPMSFAVMFFPPFILLSFFGEFLINKKPAHAARRFGAEILICIASLIMLGRGKIIFNPFSIPIDIAKQLSMFSGHKSGLEENITSFVNMIGSCVFPPSAIQDQWTGHLIWLDTTTYLWAFGIVVVVLAIIGAIYNHKENFYLICASCVVMAFIVHGIMGWASFESPLFAAYYYWAVIPLALAGVDAVIDKLKIQDKIGKVCHILICLGCVSGSVVMFFTIAPYAFALSGQ